MDQALAAVGTHAAMVARFYQGLADAGMPHDLIAASVIEFQSHLQTVFFNGKTSAEEAASDEE